MGPFPIWNSLGKKQRREISRKINFERGRHSRLVQGRTTSETIRNYTKELDVEAVQCKLTPADPRRNSEITCLCV